jgi:cell division septation protein DedD
MLCGLADAGHALEDGGQLDMRIPTIFLLIALTSLTGCRDEPDPPPPATPAVPEAPAETPVDTPVDSPAPDPDAPDPEAPDPLAPGPARPGADAGEAVEDDPARPGETLYTVQVAAFTNRDAAELWRDRLGSGGGLPVWTSVTELGGRTFYRVRVGAVPTVTEARRLGSMLTARYDWPVWVAPLGPADQVPAGAVDRTRRVIAAG